MRHHLRFAFVFRFWTLLFFIRRCLAVILGLLAFVCLWTGLEPKLLLPVPSEATAESGFARSAEGSSDRSLPRAVLLQTAVDSVVVSLGGALASLEREEDRHAVVVKALDALSFDLGGDIHFTAWEGSRLLHSPLSPDAAGLDFDSALDTRGKPFVRALRERGDEGGFVRTALPRRQYTLDNDKAADTGPVSEDVPQERVPWYDEPVRLTHTESEVNMLAYTRKIPASNWQISAFMVRADSGEGVAARAAGAQPFSSVWSAPDPQTVQGPDPGYLRKGLLVSGLSLTGLAGLLLTPGLVRREEDV